MKRMSNIELEYDPCTALFFIVANLMNFGENSPGRQDRDMMKTLFQRQKMALFAIEFGTRRHPEGVTLSVVARMMNIPLPSASQLIESLVKKELCQRAVNPRNHRTVQITLTDSGRRLTKRIVEKTTQKLRELQEGLEKEEIETFEKVVIHCYQRRSLIFDKK